MVNVLGQLAMQQLWARRIDAILAANQKSSHMRVQLHHVVLRVDTHNTSSLQQQTKLPISGQDNEQARNQIKTSDVIGELRLEIANRVATQRLLAAIDFTNVLHILTRNIGISCGKSAS